MAKIRTEAELTAWATFFAAAIAGLTPKLEAPGLLIHADAIADDAAAIADEAFEKWRSRAVIDIPIQERPRG